MIDHRNSAWRLSCRIMGYGKHTLIPHTKPKCQKIHVLRTYWRWYNSEDYNRSVNGSITEVICSKSGQEILKNGLHYTWVEVWSSHLWAVSLLWGIYEACLRRFDLQQSLAIQPIEGSGNLWPKGSITIFCALTWPISLRCCVVSRPFFEA